MAFDAKRQQQQAEQHLERGGGEDELEVFLRDAKLVQVLHRSTDLYT